MNEKDALWNEIHGIFLGDDDTDAAVLAYESGDTAELGRIIASHVKNEMMTRHTRVRAYNAKTATESRYAVTKRGIKAMSRATVYPTEFRNAHKGVDL